MLIVLAIYVFILVFAVFSVLKPERVNRLSVRVLCALRLMKRERLEKPIPRWENTVTFVIGLLLIAFVVSDASGLKVGLATDKSPQWESRTASTLDAETRKKMDGAVNRLIKSGKCVGMVIGFVDGDKSGVIGYGRKKIGSNVPPDADTLFEIGSITKTFTALSLAIMAERGEIKLDDPLSRFLPKSVRVPDYKGRQITLVDLASHTSGLPCIPGALAFLFKDDPYASYSNEMMYRFLNGYKLPRSPGAQYEYSNMGMGLVGLALSRRLGTSYEDMVRSLVWKPLGMTDTAIKLSKDQRSRFAPGYALQSNLGRVELARPSSPWTFQECFVGAGGIRSTANDMVKYLRANMGLGPNAAALPFDTIQKAKRDIGDEMWIGLGWHGLKLNAKESLIWHNGETGGYHSTIVFSRTYKKGLVILCNSAADGDAVDAFGFKLLAYMLTRSP
jgi:D-alanyl-D-alanine-carboxypeptidase/D-alanyl-D-alanine-endopeptidase